MLAMLRVVIVGTVLGAWASLVVEPMPAAADQAPFWESPVGLTPGHPDHQVRMVAENVNIQIIERGEAVVAVVNAEFEMLNQGADITMLVGFPSWTLDVISPTPAVEEDPDRRPFSPISFTPASLTGFRVRADDVEYRASEREVAVGRFSGSKWFVWEMPYPSGRSTRVHVSYEQPLTSLSDEHSRPYVQPMYVLRTGALWDGTIGEAVITMTAPSGGALLGGPGLFSRIEANETVTTPRSGELLGADQAAESSETHIIWRLRDFKPTQDVGTTYVLAGPWQALRQREAALASGSASAEDYLHATQSVLRLMGRWGPHGVPQAIVARYPARARAWARQSVELDPLNAAAWEAVGDVERWFAMPTRKHHGELGCWSSAAADAYRRAIDLGSLTAAEQLEDLFSAADDPPAYLAPIEPCTGSPASALAVVAVRTSIKAGNRTWADAVGLRGTTDELPRYFADHWLAMLTDEVNTLRALGQYRAASLRGLTFRSIAFTAPDAAVVETTEDWDDRTYRADRSVVRDASGRLTQRYELRLRDGAWKVVGATLVREAPPGGP